MLLKPSKYIDQYFVIDTVPSHERLRVFVVVFMVDAITQGTTRFEYQNLEKIVFAIRVFLSHSS